MIAEINKAWNWKGFNATEIVRVNEFGNVIFKSEKEDYWRICPEELSCDKIAESDFQFAQISGEAEFIEDWEMKNFVDVAKSELGKLEENKKYCLKMPAVIGGLYEKTNFGKISFAELILMSGKLGFQIKDMNDGQKIRLEIKN